MSTVRAHVGTPLVLLAVVLAAGCLAQPAARLRFAGDNPDLRAGGAMSFVAYQTPFSIGSIVICLTSPAAATITKVALRDPRGSGRVDAFAVRPRTPTTDEPFLDARAMSLVEFGGGFDPDGTQTVSGACAEPGASEPGANGAHFELGVQLSWSSGDITSGAGLDLTYEIDGVSVTSEIPFAIALCRDACPENPWGTPGASASDGF